MWVWYRKVIQSCASLFALSQKQAAYQKLHFSSSEKCPSESKHMAVSQEEEALVTIAMLQWRNVVLQSKVKKMKDQCMPLPDEDKVQDSEAMLPKELYDMKVKDVAIECMRRGIRTYNEYTPLTRGQMLALLQLDITLPIGLKKMSVKNVAIESMRRGLRTYNGYTRLTKKQMIALLQQHVEAARQKGFRNGVLTPTGSTSLQGQEYIEHC